MAKLAGIFHCGIIVGCFVLYYVVQGSEILENGRKYKIMAVTNGLVMTANEGVHGKCLGIVHLKKFDNCSNQKWEYIYSRQAYVFKSEVNTYNNVTTNHDNEKGDLPVWNNYTVIMSEGYVHTIRKKLTRKTKNNPQCLQSMGEGKAVQLLPCKVACEDQLWKFEMLPDAKE